MSVESLRSLEQVRQRLNTLANTIGKLLHDLDTNDPLPSWYATSTSSYPSNCSLMPKPLNTGLHCKTLPIFSITTSTHCTRSSPVLSHSSQTPTSTLCPRTQAAPRKIYSLNCCAKSYNHKSKTGSPMESDTLQTTPSIRTTPMAPLRIPLLPNRNP